MPIYNRYGSNEYIYAWIAPYGEYSDEIDTAVSDAKYLISRLFYENQHGFSNWDQSLMKFEPVGASIELGGYYYWTGSTDTIELNHTFDDILTYGGIYHLMSHPAIIDWENDVYYYEPQFDTIMDRIEETCHDLGYGSEVKIYMDAESYLPEQEVIEYLEQNMDSVDEIQRF